MSLLAIIGERNRSGGGGGVSDPDAQNYIDRVEAADSASLESGVKDAINQLFLDMKAASAPISGTNWDSVVAGSMILTAGPRTLAGLLEPLYPNATLPTNTNFVSGDYNRKTGLMGASGKYISFRDMTGGPTLNDNSVFSWVSDFGTPGTNRALVTSELSVSVRTGVYKSSATNLVFYSSSSTSLVVSGVAETDYGFYGLSRSDSTGYTHRYKGASAFEVRASTGFSAATSKMFTRSNLSQQFDGRLKSGGVTRSIDLAAMEAALATYYAGINAAIP